MKVQKYHDDSILIVCESAIHQTQKQILKEHAKGINITSLNRFIQSFDPSNRPDWTLRYECYHRFKNIQDQLHYFKNSVLSSSFIDECLDFLNLLHFYDVQIHELPVHSKSAIELKTILESIYDLKTKALYQKKILSSLPEDLSNVYIDILHPTMIEEAIIRILLDHQAHLLSHERSIPLYEYYHANNPRCEIEAIAQKIITENMDLNDVMIASCNSKSISTIVSVFDRYQIPYSLSSSKPSSTAFQAAALIEFALKNNFESFNECLTQNCFGTMSDLIKAQKTYPYNYDQNYPDLTEIELQGDVFSDLEIRNLRDMITKANLQKLQIYPYCERLTHATDLKDLLLCIDEILRTFHASSLSFNSAMRKIQTLFKESLPYLKEKDDLNILLDEIKKIKLSNNSKRMNCVTILSYSKMNESLPITFIPFATQDHFSSFKPMNGIFDETYVSFIKKFPSLMDRYQHHHHCMLERINSGHRIIISYPLSNYLGKNYESALDIEMLLNKESIPYPFLQLPSYEEKILPLDEQCAQNLYIRNHEIKGSVSSLEKYVGCPYAYFLKYGCHIQEPLEAGFNVQKIGTLNHAVLENLVNLYHKDYVHASMGEVTKIIDTNIDDMKTVFPHLQFELIRDLLIANMKLNLMILSDMEESSSMTPSYCEYKWERILPVNENFNLHLVGYVDRIDTSETAFRIIDYKSSQKKLEKDKVFSGQQLQLCTYLMQMNDELKLRPLGGFYYSFQNPKIQLPYRKMARKTKTIDEITNETIYKEILKMNRLQGWIFDDNVEMMDENGSHILGIKNTKSKGIYASNVLNIEEISESIQEMMKMIVSQIISGNVSCEPNEAACLFCKYRPICRFIGNYTEKKQLVDFPACMNKETDNNE